MRKLNPAFVYSVTDLERYLPSLRFSLILCINKITPGRDFVIYGVMIIDTAIREQPNIVQRQMMSNGELDRMRELLRVRLAECGWRDEMILLCRKVIAESDINTLTVDDILDKITPQGRALVPDAVKKELLQKIKTYLMEEANLIPPASSRSNVRHRT